MTEQHKGAVKADGPMTREHLDKLVADCQPSEDQSLQICCPQCGATNITVAYTQGFLVLACLPCERQLGLIVVAGPMHLAMGQVMDKLDQLLNMARPAQ